MAFLDEEEGAAPPEVPERPRRPENGPRRRRQQYLVRRLIGVGLGLGFLILVILAFRGCLQAREERGIKNYVTDVGTIMTESEQRGKEFFDVLEGGTGSSDLDYERQIQLVRGASQSLLDRSENLSVPDQMSDAQGSVVMTLKLRRDALDKIADNITKALGDEEQADALDTITNQMASLYSSDVLYSQVAKPDMESVVEEEEITVPDLPAGNFMPDPEPTAPANVEWLDQTKILDALSLASGGTDLADGTHGLGVISVAVGGVVLSTDTTNTLSSSDREVAVEVQNQGTVEESGVTVVVTVEGEDPVEETINTIAPGETQVAKMALQTVPQGGTEATLEVLVEPVAGESVTDNNEYSYTVTFG